jgi:transposase
VAAERDETARAAWRDTMRAHDAAQFVFVDESSANTTLTPRYGRAPRNQRVAGSAPRNYRHNTTLVAALTPDGLRAPMLLEGAMNSDAFAAYLGHVLIPQLRPGQFVILDNLSVHKRTDLRQQIEAAGSQLIFLPAYSPDFNPIEHAFSKLKTRLRQAEARTQDALDAAIAAALATITHQDAHGWFHHCSYDLNGQTL